MLWEMLSTPVKFDHQWDLLYFVTLRFNALLLLVAALGHVFFSQGLYTNGFDSSGLNTSQNKLHPVFSSHLRGASGSEGGEARNYCYLFVVAWQTRHIESNKTGGGPAVHIVNLKFTTNQMQTRCHLVGRRRGESESLSQTVNPTLILVIRN